LTIFQESGNRQFSRFAKPSLFSGCRQTSNGTHGDREGSCPLSSHIGDRRKSGEVAYDQIDEASQEKLAQTVAF
jgi:hypothetical protein